jgi:hypothetical protein
LPSAGWVFKKKNIVTVETVDQFCFSFYIHLARVGNLLDTLLYLGDAGIAILDLWEFGINGYMYMELSN